jgi:hypothetical protein
MKHDECPCCRCIYLTPRPKRRTRSTGEESQDEEAQSHPVLSSEEEEDARRNQQELEGIAHDMLRWLLVWMARRNNRRRISADVISDSSSENGVDLLTLESYGNDSSSEGGGNNVLGG